MKKKKKINSGFFFFDQKHFFINISTKLSINYIFFFRKCCYRLGFWNRFHFFNFWFFRIMRNQNNDIRTTLQIFDSIWSSSLLLSSINFDVYEKKDQRKKKLLILSKRPNSGVYNENDTIFLRIFFPSLFVRIILLFTIVHHRVVCMYVPFSWLIAPGIYFLDFSYVCILFLFACLGTKTFSFFSFFFFGYFCRDLPSFSYIFSRSIKIRLTRRQAQVSLFFCFIILLV